MRETLYSPPDREGPSVVREAEIALDCTKCKHHRRSTPCLSYCLHDDAKPQLISMAFGTPDWCPITSEDTETWERRLKGGMPVLQPRSIYFGKETVDAINQHSAPPTYSKRDCWPRRIRLHRILKGPSL